MGVTVATTEGYVKLRWRCEGDPEEMISTIGIRPADFTTGMTAQAMADKVHACWAAAFTSQFLNIGWTWHGVEVWKGPAEAPSDTAENADFIAGAAAGAPLPTNCAALVRKRTSQGGPKMHGRMFLPAGHLTESRVDANGFLEGTLLNQLGEALDTFQEGIEGTTGGDACELLLFHQNIDLVPGGPATVITDLVAQPRISTQRRRMR